MSNPPHGPPSHSIVGRPCPLDHGIGRFCSDVAGPGRATLADPRWARVYRSAEHLGNVAAPTLAIVGERDLPDFRAIADTLEQRIPNTQRTVPPVVGHMSNMEDPDGFNEAVLSFLAGI